MCWPTSFAAFPDDWTEVRRQVLGYLQWSPTGNGEVAGDEPEALLASVLRCEPIVHEDFMPVPAAGIFQSNLGDEAVRTVPPAPTSSGSRPILARRCWMNSPTMPGSRPPPWPPALTGSRHDRRGAVCLPPCGKTRNKKE
ncbi:2-oxoadipate dioxygenase/decarboxylase family protein [Paracoccus rhizosphaerae]|uniref:2-oxoadipate dioxygenase/decarboxylase n=1 Tax=Paracoccus rhizosphaerae TaxID=1133347 RepID=A0ABV6CRF1_9RHOB